jgi:hypothetical protein
LFTTNSKENEASCPPKQGASKIEKFSALREEAQEMGGRGFHAMMMSATLPCSSLGLR